MKYFTKEWYNLMQCLDYTLCMKPIADKEYTDEDIEALYSKKLKAEIARDRKEYNEPPIFFDMDFDDDKLEDFAFFDEETGKFRHHESMEEVKRAHEEEKARLLEEFENRPPFDPKETIETFENVYKGELEHGYESFPDWVRDEVDIRLIALGYLPRSVYNRLKIEEKQNKQAFNRIMREAQKALDKENKKIPERIKAGFGFHDGTVLSLKQIGADWVMLIEQDGYTFEGNTPYVRVVFTNGKIIERDNSEVGEDCWWLYDEIYKTENGYEAHMLFRDNGLCYLTIACDDITIEGNINL